jgi:hypothetical protein
VVAPRDPDEDSVLLLADLAPGCLARLFDRFGLALQAHEPGAALPGSYWGAPEAGLVAHRLHVRPDTPVHSALHEGCHFVCMSEDRRAALDTDAGSDDLEECAVCYLQVLLADELPGFGRERAWRDMDAWGYSFRLGGTRAWFEGDAADARDWLIAADVLDAHGKLTWRLRGRGLGATTIKSGDGFLDSYPKGS